MVMISDLLYQLAGSSMAERELADELRTDVTIVQQCLQELGKLAIVNGPTGNDRQWTAVPEDAPFDVMVTKAKAGGVNVRDTLPAFVARAS
jgi:hypothetical protein